MARAVSQNPPVPDADTSQNPPVPDADTLPTQVAVHELAVVHLPTHGSDFLELVLLGFHSLFELLQLFIFRKSLLLAAFLLLQKMQPLLLTGDRT